MRKGMVGSRAAAVALSLAGLTLASCAPPREPPNAADAAAYFGVTAGNTFTFRQASGVTETHAFDEVESFDDRLLLQRVARAGGFVVSDRTQTFEVRADGLYLHALDDCINRCVELAEPIQIGAWPIAGGDVYSGEVEATETNNGSVTGTTTERHRVQYADESERTVAAGTFTGFDAIWTRTVDGSTETARFFFAPDLGFLWHEGFDGTTIELSEDPPTADPSSTD